MTVLCCIIMTVFVLLSFYLVSFWLLTKGYPPQSPIPFKLQSVAYTDCFVTGHPLRSSNGNMVDGIPSVSERCHHIIIH